MELLEALRTRRSIRAFKAEAVATGADHPDPGGRPLVSLLGQHPALGTGGGAGRDGREA